MTPKIRLENKDILTYLNKKIMEAKMSATANPEYWTGIMAAYLDVQDFIIKAETVLKTDFDTEYKEVKCEICTTKYTAEMGPGEMSSECPACGHKNLIWQ